MLYISHIIAAVMPYMSGLGMKLIWGTVVEFVHNPLAATLEDLPTLAIKMDI